MMSNERGIKIMQDEGYAVRLRVKTSFRRQSLPGGPVRYLLFF